VPRGGGDATHGCSPRLEAAGRILGGGDYWRASAGDRRREKRSRALAIELIFEANESPARGRASGGPDSRGFRAVHNTRDPGAPSATP